MGLRALQADLARRAAAASSPTSRELTQGNEPEKSLHRAEAATGGRNNYGRITWRFRGGGHKQRYPHHRLQRDKIGVPAKVAAIEYDPNRTARIALLHYADGEKRYILAPDGLEGGRHGRLVAQRRHQAGQRLPLRVHPARHDDPQRRAARSARAGSSCRSAGVGAQLMAKEGD